MIRPSVLVAALIVLLTGLTQAQAQNPYAPRLIVNERAITNFEVSQRTQMLRLFRSPGNIDEEAIKALIEDRLRMAAAKQLDIKIAPDKIQSGMEEFAGRANLTADQFVSELGKAGVSPQTFRDFVEAGLAWREVIRTKFAPKVAISEADIDREIAASGSGKNLKVLISELVIPAPPGREEAAMALALRLKAQIKTEGGFASAARQHSAAATGPRGGRLDWMPLANLPPAIAPLVLGLAPGQVSDPVEMGGAIALFQLRALQEDDGPTAKSQSLDYAQYAIPAGKTAADIQAKVDGCDDLYGLNKGQPEAQLLRETKLVSEVPTGIGMELAKLDKGESTLINGGVLLMLCSRKTDLAEEPSREDVRSTLLNKRLSAYADGYLEELRADAIIVEP